MQITEKDHTHWSEMRGLTYDAMSTETFRSAFIVLLKGPVSQLNAARFGHHHYQQMNLKWAPHEKACFVYIFQIGPLSSRASSLEAQVVMSYFWATSEFLSEHHLALGCTSVFTGLSQCVKISSDLTWTPATLPTGCFRLRCDSCVCYIKTDKQRKHIPWQEMLAIVPTPIMLPEAHPTPGAEICGLGKIINWEKIGVLCSTKQWLWLLISMCPPSVFI